MDWQGRAFAFVGARGGAGASSAAAFAAATLTAANVAPVLLCDLDEGHAGADVALGLESAPGFRWQHFADLAEPPAANLVAGALPRVAGVDVLAWGDAPSHTWQNVPMVLQSILTNYQAVVFDIGRAHLTKTLAIFNELSLPVQWLLVCPGDVTSVNAAARVRHFFDDELRLLIRCDSQSGLRDKQILDALKVKPENSAQFTTDPKVHRALIRGEFARLAATGPKVMNQIGQLLTDPH